VLYGGVEKGKGGLGKKGCHGGISTFRKNADVTTGEAYNDGVSLAVGIELEYMEDFE
jgi:hypothetical protein